MDFYKAGQLKVEGFKSFHIGKGRYINMYPLGSDEYNEFEKGWLKAQRAASRDTLIEYDKHHSDLEKQRIQSVLKANNDSKNEYLRAKGKR